MKLSRWFTMSELTLSETAARYGLDNDPPAEVVENLKLLAARLDDIREYLGHPVHISSGYRSPAVNRAVGGSLKPPSAHTRGLAADLTCPGYGTPLQVAKAIASSGIPFDQVIHEFGRWVHVGIAPAGQPERGQRLTIDRTGTRGGLS